MISDYIYNHKGVYRVGDKQYINKLEACVALNSIPGDHHLHWDYHEHVFDRLPWNLEPPVDIKELYKQRALQLREQYDHLVLFYSGGADSHTVLQSFLENNIKLDEVFVWGAFKAEENIIQQRGWSRDPGYYTREVEWIVKPILKELQKKHKFEITMWDWTDQTLSALDDPDWFWTIGTRYAPDCLPRTRLHDLFKHNDRFEGKGKKVAFIYGIDKPRLMRDDKNVYFAFIDLMITTGIANNADIEKRTWENDEYFYWSPNMPEIVLKQAHSIYKYLRSQNRLHELAHVNNRGAFHAAEYYQTIHPIIYPDWNPMTWQIKKPTNSVRDQLGEWFFDLAPKEYQNRWREGVLEMERVVGKKHFNSQSVWNGITGSYSKLYKIGELV